MEQFLATVHSPFPGQRHGTGLVVTGRQPEHSPRAGASRVTLSERPKSGCEQSALGALGLSLVRDEGASAAE